MASRLLHLRRSGKTGTRSSPLVGAIDKFATMQLGQNPSLRALADLGRFWVNRYTGDPAASPVMSNIPPKAEVKSEHLRLRHRPARVDGAARAVIQAPKPEPRIMLYELSDYEWTAIKPMLPNKPRGVRRVNDRRVLNGIFWVLPQM